MAMTLRWTSQWLVLLWLICCPLRASSQQLPLRYYNQTDGLGNMAITALAQEPGGYIWIGTQNGLFRYDGARFQRFELSGSAAALYITALHVDGDGRLWAGTNEGLYLWQGQRFLSIQPGNIQFTLDQGRTFATLAPDRLLLISRDRLWLVHSEDHGHSWQVREYFETAQLLQHPEMGSLFSIQVGQHGELWMGCTRALCHYDQGKLTVLGKESGLPAENWRSLLLDRQQRLWASSEQHVYMLPPGGHVFQDRSPDQRGQKKARGLPFLAEDKEGRIFSRQDQGVIRWNGKRWESFGESSGLIVGGGIDSLLVDRDGGVWFGSLGHGLVHWIGYPTWENWTTKQGLPNDVVLSFLRDRENLLHVGTRSGSAILQKDGYFSVSPETYGGTSHQWSSMAEDARGNIWAGSLSGLLVRRGRGAGADVKFARLPSINSLFFDRSGQLWIATDVGIYSIRQPESNPTPVKVAVTEFPFMEEINAFQGCQGGTGVLWFVTDKGLLRFDGAHWRKSRPKPSAQAFQPSAIACTRGGTLWLGGETGNVWRADEQGEALEINDITPSLLQDQSVTAVFEDRRGWLWVSTDAGVGVWNRQQWRFFNHESGLVWNDTDLNTFYEDSDGSMWVATSGGASHILRPESLFAPLQLDVLVESIARDGDVSVRDRPVRLPWSSGPLTFKLAALSYQNRETLVFRYRMQGLEPDWSKTGVPELRYAALPPGRYHFQVAAENPAMHAVSPQVDVEIEILPPWWGTKIFYSACGALLMLLLFLIHRYRVSRLVARQRLQEQLARERAFELEMSREEERKHLTREIHDELGQYLSALRMGVSVVGMEFGGKNPSLQGKMERMIALVDSTIKVVRNVVSSLRPSALDMGIVSALEWLAEEFTGNTGIPCSLDVCEDNIVLDDKRATTIFRIAQESLTNISRHANASRVDISLTKKEKHYVLEVRDNGKGFDTGLRKKKSFGLIGIRERTSMLGGEAFIYSVPGVGTTIRVSIPIADGSLNR
ncbi:sensor histidine kinase [Collimonas sp.]|jgi:signal transduction histidine kinase/ligand-binding sensor domain-containing protein|uniref:sensor histidine kinase n=1 Tax=Collimonas sp. TaxID=1963772 RepID=UPI002B8C0187|nr:two-component regulator propeller domain-containing protein [Collimonas sp.]HWX01852.1 two-component regulator propeller domain-containing protein [Collimonas sp.]